MAPHSSALAWKIPWTGEPGGLQSMGSLRVRHDRANYTHYSGDICVGSFVSLGQLQRIAGGQGALQRLRGCCGQPTSSSLPLPASVSPRSQPGPGRTASTGVVCVAEGLRQAAHQLLTPSPRFRVPEKPARPRAHGQHWRVCICARVCTFPCEVSQTTSPSRLRDVQNQSGNILLTAFSLFTRLSFFSSF